MKRSYISILLVFTLVFSLFTPFGKVAYGANGSFEFNWEQNKFIKDIIQISSRKDSENELVFNWSYDKLIGGTDIYKGKYKLTYNLTDGERIEITVDNSLDNTAIVDYKIALLNRSGEVIGYRKPELKAYDEKGSKVYWQYNSGNSNWFEERNTNNIWHNSSVGGAEPLPDNIFAPTGIQVEMGNNGPHMRIDAGSTAVLNYDKKDIVIKLDETSQNITLGISGIERNKIYNFKLTCERNGNVYSNEMNIFKLVEFQAGPVKDPTLIDKRIDKSLYAGQNPRMEIKVAIPSVWDTVYEFNNSPYKEEGYEGLSAVVNLKSLQTGENIQINIDNIYDISKAPNITESSTTEAVIDEEYGIQRVTENYKEYYTFRLKNMEPSSIYTSSSISLSPIKKDSNSGQTILKTIASSLPSGESAYTYLKYDTDTKSGGERVLKITPYPVNGTYYVYQAQAQDVEGERISSYTYSAASGIKEFELPVPNDGEYYYKILFIHELGEIYSQTLVDVADKNKYLVTPKLEVKNYEIITENQILNGVTVKNQKLRLSLSWNGGTAESIDSLLEKGPIVYNLKKTPFGPRVEDDRYSTFIKLNVEKDYKLTPTAENWDTLKKCDAKGEVKVNITADGKEEKVIVFNANLEFDLFSEADLASRDEPSKIFYYPSVYYLKMNGQYSTLKDLDKSTPYCNPVSITLDETANTVLPPPQGLTLDTPTTKSYNVNWNTVTDSVYGNYIKLNDFTLQEPNGVGVNIFVTQLNVLNEKDQEKQLNYFKDDKNSDMISVSFDSLPKEYDEVTKITTVNLASYLKDIQNNKMIRITDVHQVKNLNKQTIVLDGLDRNTSYYTAIQTVLNVISNSDKSKKTIYSDAISDILTITTKNEDPLNPPKPDEISPQMPNDFRQDTSVEQLPNKITLAWTDVKDPESIANEKVKKEYELIRVEKKLNDSLLNKRNSFDDFWANDLGSVEKVGLQTVSTEDQPKNILTYNGSDFILDETKTTKRYTYEMKNKPKLQLIDETVMPNKLYYYYIRTVRMEETSAGSNTYKEAAWSSWQPVSVTTATVKSPTDLKVERNKTYFEYDPYTEAVISFFAPIPVGTSMADIASLYPLEYAVQEDNGEWKVISMNVTDSSLFKQGNEKKEGYQQFVYKITGLTPDKYYTVKVRMKSRVNSLTESIPVYDVSLYSNSDSFRTEMNQDDYDNENETNKWLEKFDNDVLELSTKNYWLIENSQNYYEAIYRTKTFDGELQKATSGEYEFEANNQPNQTYYIPASSISLSDGYNIGYRAVKDNMEVAFKPNSFDSSESEAVLNVLKTIKDKNYKDYYIKLDLSFNGTNEAINGSPILSDKAQVDVSIVGSDEVEKKLDDTFVQMFKDAIADSETIKAKVRNQLKKDLEKEIKNGASDEELYKLVDDAVKEVYDDILGDIEDEFDKKVSKEYDVDYLSQTVRITFTPNTINGEATIYGYRNNNSSWEDMNTRDYGNKKGFETNLLGLFAFAGKTINIPDIGGIPNSTEMKKLIAKYGLDNYLGKDIIDTDSYATKYQVVGCISKMAGNSTNQNEIAFLKSKGINVTQGKLYDNILNQEAVYLIMSLYEVKTNTKIENVRITNYNLSSNIKNANENYKKSLQVAAQLGICNDNSISPKDNITIRDLLKYLSNLNSKVKL